MDGAAQIIKGIEKCVKSDGEKQRRAVHLEPHAGSCKLKDLFFTIELWRGDRNKSTCSRNHHIVQAAAGTVDHQQISVFIPASYDSNVFVLRVKGQVARLGLAPGNICAVGMLGIGAAAMANDIGSAGGVIKHPVHKTGTV